MCDNRLPSRQKIPLDGPGPRGFPDSYYTSRTLDSTFRYMRFVKKLRAIEEETRKGEELQKKTEKDKWIVNFFTKCDRGALIKDVARRVDICMKSYEKDLNAKRQRLLALYEQEEERNIRMFVEQAQAGRDACWQDKKDRLAYLLAKRQKEHEEKYKDTPISKCVHVLPCVFKKHAAEAAQIQLYQIKEKQARKMAEIEFDKMWNEVIMKESDALAARMELDAIERKRREIECKQYSDHQLEEKRRDRERMRVMLIEESKRYKAQWDEELREEQEAERKRQEQRTEIGDARKQMKQEREAELKKRAEEMKLVSDTWDYLGALSQEDEKRKIANIRQREKDLDECNKRLICMRKQLAAFEHQYDHLFDQEAEKQDLKQQGIRCKYIRWAHEQNEEVRAAQRAQIQQHIDAKNKLKQQLKDEELYYTQLSDQLKQLIEHKRVNDLEHRVKHENDLKEQIEYNRMLKERARQEELEERKKSTLAAQQYKEEIKQMLCRESHSEAVHPFTRAIRSGLTMRVVCPCSKPDYCKRPEENGK